MEIRFGAWLWCGRILEFEEPGRGGEDQMKMKKGLEFFSSGLLLLVLIVYHLIFHLIQDVNRLNSAAKVI